MSEITHLAHEPYRRLELVAADACFGDLFRAVESATGADVLLLRLPAPAESFLSLEQVRVRYELFADERLPMLPFLGLQTTPIGVCAVYRLLPGALPLAEYAADKPLHLVLDVLLHLCHALAALHRRPLWHGGLVPAYIWVLPDGDVRLLAMYTDSPMTVYNLCPEPIESLQYFAPETMPKGTLDSRTEIYNLGVLFYRILTGEFPFSGTGNQLYPPSRSNLHVPPHLDRMILKMIHGKPTKRFHWITQIIHELSRMIGKSVVQPPLNVETCGSQHLFAAEFTGRVAETQRLREQIDQMQQGVTRTLLLTGRPGVGRRRLVFETVRHYMSSMSFILSVAKGKTYATAEELAVILLSWSLSDAEMAEVADLYLPRLAAALPRVALEFRSHVLARHVDAKWPDESLPRLLVDFFCAVVQVHGHPIVFVLSDAHLADRESLAVFDELCRAEATQPAATRATIGVIGIADEPTHALHHLFPTVLPVPPLALTELRECVGSRFGEASFLNQEFLAWLDHHANGSLGAAFQLLEYLADTGQLYLQRDMWHLRPATVAELNIPESMESLIRFRLEQLPPLAMEICQLMALFQGPFMIVPIAQALELELSELSPLLNLLEEQGLILPMHGLPGGYRFPSNNTKLHVYSLIPPAQRTSLHRRLAHAMRAVGSKDVVEIGHHLEQGEEWEAAILHHLYAARRSYRQHRLAEAEAELAGALDLYRICGRPAPQPIYRLYARVLELSGKILEALTLYEERYRATRSLYMFIGLLMNAVIVKRFNIVEPHLPEVRRLLADVQLAPHQRIDLLIVMAMYHVEMAHDHRYILEMRSYHVEHVDLLREQLTPMQYVNWLANLQVMLRYVPSVPHEERVRYLYEAATLAEHHQFKRNLALVYSNLGYEYLDTLPRKAKEFFLKSIQTTQELGDRYNSAVTLNYLVDIHRLLGDLPSAYRCLEQVPEVGAPVFRDVQTTWLQRQVDLLLFVEQPDKAEPVVRNLVRAAKQNGHQKMRETAFLYQFQIAIDRGQHARADRMWPLVEQICRARHMTPQGRVLRAHYHLLGRQYERVVLELDDLRTAQEVSEWHIRLTLSLIEALRELGRSAEALPLAHNLIQAINKAGCFGWFGWVHLALGQLYQQEQAFVRSTLHYKQALLWFRKLNHHNRILEIEQKMRGRDDEMIATAERLLRAGAREGAAAALSASTITRSETAAAGSALAVSSWLKGVIRERYDVVDTLTENEIVLDALRRLSACVMVQQVCEQLASIMFENLLIEHLHLYVRISETRVEMLHMDEQHQYLDPCADVLTLFDRVQEHGVAYEQVGTDSHLLALPIHAHDDQAVAVLVLEKLNTKSAFTEREKRFLQNMTQLAASKIENAILYEAMFTDSLTGLYTRDYFMKRLREEMSKVRRYGIDLSFLMLDLDNFRLINNRFGHPEGDRVLRLVAKTLRQSVRDVDIVGRYGGEELIVILPNTNGAGAQIAAERLLNALRSLRMPDDLYRITASVGVASVDCDQPSDAAELIEMADRAELFAKQNGKDQVVCHWELPPVAATIEKDPSAP